MEIFLQKSPFVPPFFPLGELTGGTPQRNSELISGYYILRKHCSIEERRHLLYEICSILDVVGTNKEQVFNSINNERFIDFEERLQVECAKSKGIDFIVTRNMSDFFI